MSLVEIDGATLRYGALTALSGLDLRLEPGEVLGLLGHNGAGKTTTITTTASRATKACAPRIAATASTSMR